MAELGAVNVLKANLVLLIALGQYDDGVTVSHADDLARELKGGGREGEEEGKDCETALHITNLRLTGSGVNAVGDAHSRFFDYNFKISSMVVP